MNKIPDRSDTECPHCGEEPQTYFEQIDERDHDEVWTVTTPRKHADSYACERGCEVWSEGHWFFHCEHCGEPVAASCVYVQPCNANGYVERMAWEKIEDEDNEARYVATWGW